jgi:hypothetical protein
MYFHLNLISESDPHHLFLFYQLEVLHQTEFYPLICFVVYDIEVFTLYPYESSLKVTSILKMIFYPLGHFFHLVALHTFMITNEYTFHNYIIKLALFDMRTHQSTKKNFKLE